MTNLTPWKFAVPAERLRYIAHAMDACGGDGILAAKMLGINRRHYSQYVRCAVTEMRASGCKARMPAHPRFAKATGGVRKPRPIQQVAFGKLTTLQAHMTDYERRYLLRALRRSGNNKRKASVILGLRPSTFSNIVLRKHRELLRDFDKLTKHTASAKEKARYWAAVMALVRVMVMLASFGVTFQPVVPTSFPTAAEKREEL